MPKNKDSKSKWQPQEFKPDKAAQLREAKEIVDSYKPWFEYRKKETEAKETANQLIVSEAASIQRLKRTLQDATGPEAMDVALHYIEARSTVFKALVRKAEKFKLRVLELECNFIEMPKYPANN